ncbi:MAG: Fic family protein [Opitutales bacterium]
MNLSEYQAGTWKAQYQYRSFQPSPVNLQWTWNDPQLNTMLAEANRRLGELNGLSFIVPDLDRFIEMHVVKEAQTSSRIEGTQTGMNEAIQEDPEAIDPEKRDDWREVRNYVTAMHTAIDALHALPLSNRLLCKTHSILMQGARGEHKTPGEFRRSQNWIGGATLADAVFIPPHQDDLPLLLSDLEAFWHNESIHVPHLVRIAISHYQFETIHPFLDGNGRIGRLLITLYLVSKGLLQKPCLYLSAHFEKHRTAYYDALSRARSSNDLNHWIRFFLTAIIETSKQATETFRAILKLRSKTTEQVHTLGRATPNAVRIVDYLYAKPVVTAQELAKQLDINANTANRMVQALRKLDILHEVTGQQRNRVYCFRDYYQLFL